VILRAKAADIEGLEGMTGSGGKVVCTRTHWWLKQKLSGRASQCRTVSPLRVRPPFFLAVFADEAADSLKITVEMLRNG